MLLPNPAALLKRYSSRENTAASSSTIRKTPSQIFQPERVWARPSACSARRSWAVIIAPFCTTRSPFADGDHHRRHLVHGRLPASQGLRLVYHLVRAHEAGSDLVHGGRR